MSLKSSQKVPIATVCAASDKSVGVSVYSLKILGFSFMSYAYGDGYKLTDHHRGNLDDPFTIYKWTVGFCCKYPRISQSDSHSVASRACFETFQSEMRQLRRTPDESPSPRTIHATYRSGDCGPFTGS